jgi:hypothetical protein
MNGVGIARNVQANEKDKLELLSGGNLSYTRFKSQKSIFLLLATI